MRRLLCLIFGFAFCITAHADTINVNWIVDGNTYDTSTCTVGGDLILPTPPTPETGYHFVGWEVAGYAKLEYIESTGTQYINTGIIPNVTMRVVAKVAFPDVVDTVLSWGSRTSGSYSTSLDQFYCGRSGTSLWYYSANNKISIRDGISPNVFYDIDAANTLVTETATQSIYLFALNNLGTASTGAKSKIAKFEIYDNGVMVRNFIPAKRNSDNVLGMYDTVTNTFFTNQGTGDFIAGPETGEYIY